jgi:molybdate transport system substrate-binding protein
LAALILGGAASAAELKVFGSRVTKMMIGELGPPFEQATGHKLTVVTDVAAVMKRRIEAGEPFDLAVLVNFQTDDLIKSGKLLADTRADIMKAGIGVAVKRGAQKPDISTVEAFKQTLLAARSISYADPAKGGLSGVVAGKAIERLGIAEQMKAKTKLVPGAESPDLVAKGEVELGIAQASEIVPVAGTQLVGPLPGELGSMTLFTGGVGAETQSAAAAKALIDFLSGPEAAPHFKSKGFQTGL